jgi:hypothetical protein
VIQRRRFLPFTLGSSSLSGGTLFSNREKDVTRMLQAKHQEAVPVRSLSDTILGTPEPTQGIFKGSVSRYLILGLRDGDEALGYQ